jgi:hypothetical protein
MSEKWKQQCKLRSIPAAKPRAQSVSVGAGSGGGSAFSGPAQGCHSDHFDGTYSIAANSVEIASRVPLPPAIPGDFVISLFAAGMGTDGRIEAHGSQGVRITAGPPEMPPASSTATNGAEIMVGELQNITIQRGLIPGVDQQILMEPESILVDGGLGTVTIQSMTEVKLQCAGGLSSITLTPAGIIIQGILVAIN